MQRKFSRFDVGVIEGVDVEVGRLIGTWIILAVMKVDCVMANCAECVTLQIPWAWKRTIAADCSMRVVYDDPERRFSQQNTGCIELVALSSLAHDDQSSAQTV